ncbi:hypothetical protein JCM3765_001356 [Sporobolomyces pararoseus]
MTTLPPPIQDSIPLVPPPQVPPPPSLSSSTTSTSVRPDAHTQKYDRQLRLWASSGQTLLETCKILVINSNSTSSSILKNLVLPGIGQFTILDDQLVTEKDLGTNFFLNKESLGKSRSEESVKFLKELNSDVKGNSINSNLENFLNSSSEQALKEYNLVLAVDVVPPFKLNQLSEKAWEFGIPLISVNSFGFYGSLTTQIEEITLVETHPESLIDLRLNQPFKELIEFSTGPGNEFDYDRLDSAELSHVPAVVILIKALENWKSSHEGKGPEGSKDRKEFLEEYVLNPGKRQGSDDENFQEAVGLFRRAGNKKPIPEEIEKLFKDDSCQNLTSQSSNFWILLHTLKLFTQKSEGLLPLTGSLPDMKSHSQTYIKLQKVYREKALTDLKLFNKLLIQVLDSLNDQDKKGREIISKEEIESFVKHSGWLKVLRGRKLNDMINHSEKSLLKGKINELLEQASWSSPPDQSLSIYLSIQTCWKFYEKHSRYPGSLNSKQGDLDGTLDHSEMLQLGKELLKELDYNGDELPESFSNSIKELCRSSHSTLPQTSALLGGLVAQESIKLITKQYVPLVGETCIWDGITSMTGRVKA